MLKMLRALRKARGMTLKEVAERVGVAESTVSQYENGKRDPDFETLLKLAELFDVSVDYLMRGNVYGGELTKDQIQDLISILGVNMSDIQDLLISEKINDEKLKIALFGEIVSDDMLDAVKRYARFILEEGKK